MKVLRIDSNFAQGVVRVVDDDGGGCGELRVAGDDAGGTGGTGDEGEFGGIVRIHSNFVHGVVTMPLVAVSSDLLEMTPVAPVTPVMKMNLVKLSKLALTSLKSHRTHMATESSY